MNYIIAQTSLPSPSSSVPTVYLDFPPDLLLTFGYMMFAGIFHLVCFNVTKAIYGQ